MMEVEQVRPKVTLRQLAERPARFGTKTFELHNCGEQLIPEEYVDQVKKLMKGGSDAAVTVSTDLSRSQEFGLRKAGAMVSVRLSCAQTEGAIEEAADLAAAISNKMCHSAVMQAWDVATMIHDDLGPDPGK